MNTKSLVIINGALLVAVLAVGLFYLSSAGSHSPAVSQAAPVRSSARAAVISAAPSDTTAAMLPSERTLTDEQWRRQQQDPALQMQKGSELEEEVVVVAPPMAFREPSLALGFDEDQLRAIQAVRQAFSDAMSTAGDPSSPEYLDRWQTEQNRADERLIAYLGPESFQRFYVESK